MAKTFPFFPADGGQAEDVGDSFLQYDSTDDAIENFYRVLPDDPGRTESTDHLAFWAKRFTPGRYQDAFTRSFNEMLEEVIPA